MTPLLHYRKLGTRAFPFLFPLVHLASPLLFLTLLCCISSHSTIKADFCKGSVEAILPTNLLVICILYTCKLSWIMISNGMEKMECDISSSGLICQIWEKETSTDEVNKNLYSTVIEYHMIPRPHSDKIQFLNTQNQEIFFLDICILKMLYCFR